MQVLDAKNNCFRELNKSIRELLDSGHSEIKVKNVTGQRYIADGISGKHTLYIEGIPGNDMAAYMDGPEVIVTGNAQDAIANTMNSGRVIVHGNAGDTAGYAMRGGELYIRGDAGYRVGIHMKEFKGKKPVIVIGGNAGDFLGEYMAGGVIILLGLGSEKGDEIAGSFCGTGMHGGTIYIRGSVDRRTLGKEVSVAEPDEEDMELIIDYVNKFSQYYGTDSSSIMRQKFIKLYANNKRPYGNLYAY